MNFPKIKLTSVIWVFVMLMLLMSVGCGAGETPVSNSKDKETAVDPNQQTNQENNRSLLLDKAKAAEILVNHIESLNKKLPDLLNKPEKKESMILTLGLCEIFSEIKEGKTEAKINKAISFFDEHRKTDFSDKLRKLKTGMEVFPDGPATDINGQFADIQKLFGVTGSDQIADQSSGAKSSDDGSKNELSKLNQTITELQSSIANQQYFHWLEHGGTFLVALLIGLGGGVVLGGIRRPAMTDGPPPNDPAREKQEIRDHLQPMMNGYTDELKIFIGGHFTQQEKRQDQSYNQLKNDIAKVREDHSTLSLQVKKTLENNRNQQPQPSSAPAGPVIYSEPNRPEPSFPTRTVAEYRTQTELVADVGSIGGAPDVLSKQSDNKTYHIRRFVDHRSRQPYLLALPTPDRLNAQNECSYYYTGFYNCSYARAGEIVIIKPALVEEDRGEYRLIRKGEMEIG